MSRGGGGFLYGEIQCIIGTGHTESPLHYPQPQSQPLFESDWTHLLLSGNEVAES